MDNPIHLPPSTEKFVTPSIILEKLWITQHNLDGLQKLLQWAEGYNAASTTNKIDTFEALMFYRTLANAIKTQLNPQE